MSEGRLYPRWKVCTILCPMLNCKYAIIELDQELILLPDQFQAHLKRFHNIELNEAALQSIRDRITFIRTNPKFRYTDPFFYVPRELVEANTFISTPQ